MATIKLKKPPARKSSEVRAERTPVRGTAAARKRPTLSEAQGARAEREARYQDQLRQRYGDAPPDSARRGPPQDRGGRDDARRTSVPADARSAAPSRSRDAAFEPARRASDRAAPPRARPNEPRDQHDRRDPRDLRDTQPPGRQDSRPPAPYRGTNAAGRDARPAAPYRDSRDSRDSRDDSRPAPAHRGARDDARAPEPYRGPKDDGRAARPVAPYLGPRDDGRATKPAKPKPDPFKNQSAPAGNFGPQPSARAGATARRNAALQRDDGDDDRDDRPEIPGSVRLSKRMSELGIASRREADEWIPKGWVRVDGRVVNELGSRVMPDQQITIDAKAKFVQAQKVTVLINKPIGFVSGQAEDGYEPASVLVTPDNHWHEDQSGIQFLKDHLRFLAPAGRLDIDSIGLLVLTQDGRIAKQLVGEDRDTEKEYLVRVQSEDRRPLPDASLQKLRHGLELDGEALLPAQVEWINDDQLRFVLKEGKKRQIRRMCELVGLKVLGLKRVRIGRVMLGDLPVGAWRYLRLDESFV